MDYWIRFVKLTIVTRHIINNRENCSTKVYILLKLYSFNNFRNRIESIFEFEVTNNKLLGNNTYMKKEKTAFNFNVSSERERERDREEQNKKQNKTT